MILGMSFTPWDENRPGIESTLTLFFRRAQAALADAVLFLPVFAAVGVLVAKRFGRINENGFSFAFAPLMLSFIATVFVALLYHVLFEGLLGATLGKGLAGIRVRMDDGSPCRMGASLVRNTFRIVDGLGFYLFGFAIAMLSPTRKRWGDQAAGTVVVLDNAGSAARVLFRLAWWAAFVGAGAATYFLHRWARGGTGGW